MNKKTALHKLNKIFKANYGGQFGSEQREELDVKEFRSDLIDLFDKIFKSDEIDLLDVFDATKRITGGSFHIKEAVKVANKWNFRYILWNDQLLDLKSEKYLDIYKTDLTIK